MIKKTIKTFSVFLLCFTSFHTIAVENFCKYKEGKQIIITVESKDLCPKSLDVETVKNSEKLCKQKLQKVKKVFSNEFRCFY